MVSSKVEGLLTWTKHPSFLSPQPLDSETTTSPQRSLAIHYPLLTVNLLWGLTMVGAQHLKPVLFLKNRQPEIWRILAKLLKMCLKQSYLLEGLIGGLYI